MNAVTPSDRHTLIIRWWLLGVAALVFLIVIVGGATRLTESGLSIVEWKPVTGTLPPLSEAQWQAEFAKYKTIPQYQLINRGMSLSEFKTIYWWEWGHRLLGRLIGAAFLLPFVFFLARGWVDRALKTRLWGIFALGALQGGVGWWMVYSGLADRTEVSQYRLGTHLILACLIFLALLWTAARLAGRPAVAVSGRLRGTVVVLLVLVLLQIYLGALVAGLRAGLTYNTWPLLDGSFIPSLGDLFAAQPAWRNLFENALTVQFNHRMIAYVLLAVAGFHVWDVARSGGRGPVATGALAIAAVLGIQVVTGILTLIYVVPIVLALVHQGLAVILLAVVVLHLERVSPARAAAAVGRPASAASGS